MQSAEAIDRLREHAAELRTRGVTGMYLFGSTARDEAHAGSDVDIFYDYRQDGHFSLFDIMDIRAYVEDVLQTKADVVPRKSLHRRIKDRVVSEATRIF
ncbi:MAG: nucleotidyltransferase domain-containing protein [Alphaproteobacteria bacterium]